MASDWFKKSKIKTQQTYLKKHPNSRYKTRGLVRTEEGKVEVASSDQRANHKANTSVNKSIKSTQDAKMKKSQALSKLRTQLAKFPPRPTNPKKAAAWTQRRRALQERIKAARDDLRSKDAKVSELRKSK